MTIDEHKKLIQDLALNITDQAKVTSILADLSKDYAEINGSLETANNSLEEIKKDNENLRSSNMKLFLQVGDVTKTGRLSDDENKDNSTDENQDTDQNENLKYEDLFDDKGVLK